MASGEVPIITHLGEEALSRRQHSQTAAALRAADAAGGGRGTNVVVHNYGSTEARTEQQSDGTVAVFIEQLNSMQASQVTAGRGPLAGAIHAATGSGGGNRNMIG